MRTALRWTFRGAITGAALFGITVALLGGATMSLVLFYWGAGMVMQGVQARLAGQEARRHTEIPR